MRLDAPAVAVKEMERLMGLHDDIMRTITIKVDAHEEGPSAIVQAKNSRDDRGPRGGGGFRGDRGGFRGDRDRGGDRGDRGARPDRDASKTATPAPSAD